MAVERCLAIRKCSFRRQVSAISCVLLSVVADGILFQSLPLTFIPRFDRSGNVYNIMLFACLMAIGKITLNIKSFHKLASRRIVHRDEEATNWSR